MSAFTRYAAPSRVLEEGCLSEYLLERMHNAVAGKVLSIWIDRVVYAAMKSSHRLFELLTTLPNRPELWKRLNGSRR